MSEQDLSVEDWHFEQWRKEVDRLLTLESGVVTEWLPDFDYHGFYETEISPKDIASFIIKELPSLL